MKTYFFLTTSGCHLCEEVIELLAQFPNACHNRGIALPKLFTVDIAQNDHLIDQFGEQIPTLATCVLQRSPMSQGWLVPDQEGLFLQQHNRNKQVKYLTWPFNGQQVALFFDLASLFNNEGH